MSNEIKSFGALEQKMLEGKSKKPECLAAVEFSLVGGKIFRNGLNIVHNCVFNEGNGVRFVYRDSKKSGKHFAIEVDSKFICSKFCERPGNYKLSVYRDYMGVITVKRKYDLPLEMETDPIRIALRERKIFPSDRMIVQVASGTPMAYVANLPKPKKYKAPEGSRSMAFTSDGVECINEKTQPGIKDGPVVGKVRDATFLIQYATVYGRRGRPRRWIEKLYVTPEVQLVKLEAAIDSVLNTRKVPERLLCTDVKDVEGDLADASIQIKADTLEQDVDKLAAVLVGLADNEDSAAAHQEAAIECGHAVA